MILTPKDGATGGMRKVNSEIDLLAPSMRWDDAENHKLLSGVFEIVEEARQECFRGTGGSVRRTHYEYAQAAFRATQRQVIRRFAAERGWQHSGRCFSLLRLRDGRMGRSEADRIEENCYASNHLAWDHPDVFRETRGPYRPAGVVVHLFTDSLGNAESVAKYFRLILEPLPWSWYLPWKWCRAVLYRREAERHD